LKRHPLLVPAVLAIPLALAPATALLWPAPPPRKTSTARVILKDTLEGGGYRRNDKPAALPYLDPGVQEKLRWFFRDTPGGEQASLKFDGEPHRVFLILKGKDDGELITEAHALYAAFYRAANPFLWAEFGRDHAFFNCQNGMVILADPPEDALPQRLRLALSLWAIAMSAVVAAAVCREARSRSRRPARSTIPESLLSHHDTAPEPLSAPAAASDGIQAFPPPATATAARPTSP
jgi:hypothetical protein